MATAAERMRAKRARDQREREALPINDTPRHRRFRELIDEARELAKEINSEIWMELGDEREMRFSFANIYRS